MSRLAAGLTAWQRWSPRRQRHWGALDRLADQGKIWATIGAVLVTRKGVTRRAGVRATTAAAATAAVVHLVAKPLLPRAHPTAGRFPSSRAATATAFAVGVAMEAPTIGAAVAPLAVSSAVARVRLGDRRASEVVAGMALGAALALLTRRWWPVHRGEPARARPARGAPALGDGAGLVVVANSAAGPAAGIPDVAAQVAVVLPRAQIVVPEPGVDFVDEVDAAFDRPSLADGDPPRAIGVAGGDGSVAALAGVAERRGVPLMVIPTGTLNHFARDVGIPDTDAALTAARDGSAVLVDVGLVITDEPGGRHTFVNTASLGGYPDMVRLRERWQGHWGKWPSAGLALMRVLAGASPLVVRINGRPRTIWLLFVGNGVYHPRGMAPLFRPRLDGRVLDVRYLRADLPFSRTRFVVAALLGALHRSRVLVAEQRRTLDVQIVGESVALATDGEVQPDARRFRFAVGPVPVPIYRPDAEG